MFVEAAVTQALEGIMSINSINSPAISEAGTLTVLI